MTEGSCKTIYKGCKCYLEYVKIKNSILHLQCFKCNGQFYSNLNIEGITVKDYKDATRAWKEFGKEDLGKYLNLYVQIDTLLLAVVFESFRSRYIENISSILLISFQQQD